MKSINTRFSKIGTNPMHYFNNYLVEINGYEVGTIFYIDLNELSLKHQSIQIMKFNSLATFRQNLDCWIGLGFVSKKREELVKIAFSGNSDSLLEFSKIMLLMHSDDEKINIYRNTILMKILVKSNKKVLKDGALFMRQRNLLMEDIYHEFGEFERKLMDDTKFVDLINFLWGD